MLSYGYMASGRLEPYRERITQLLGAADCHVLTIKTNSFFHDYSHEPRSTEALAAVVESIRAFDPDLVISVNRSGLHEQVKTALRPEIKVVTWFQDPYHYATPELLRFDHSDMLWFIYPNPDAYSSTLKPFAIRYGAAESQIYNVPFCLDNITFYDQQLRRDRDICFVASSFGIDFAHLFIIFSRDRRVRDVLLQAYERIKDDPHFDVPSFLVSQGVDFVNDDLGVSRELPMIVALRTGRLNLQGVFEDQINMERRIHHLAALADFDLVMYGQKDEYWVPQMSIVEPKLLRAYQFAPINEPTELAALYCRSKIGFNISRIAAANVGFSFRVPEIMACGAVLMTEGFARPALTAQGFVDGNDYLSYENPDDLRRKCHDLLQSPDRIATIAANARAKLKAIARTTTLTMVLADSFRVAGFACIADRLATLAPETVRYSDFKNVAFFGDFKGSMRFGLVTDISAQTTGA